MGTQIVTGDPLIEVYKLQTPDGLCLAPKWLRNLREPSVVWRPNQLTPQNGRIVKVDFIGFEDNKEFKMICPIIHAVPASGDPAIPESIDKLHCIYLICTPDGIQSGSAVVTMNVYNKYPEMEVVGL